MVQHVNSQVFDVTKASHCTGGVSSALASGDAGRGGPDTGQDRQDKRGVHSSTDQYLRGVSRSSRKERTHSQPHVRWTTCNDFEETWILDVYSCIITIITIKISIIKIIIGRWAQKIQKNPLSKKSQKIQK